MPENKTEAKSNSFYSSQRDSSSLCSLSRLLLVRLIPRLQLLRLLLLVDAILGVQFGPELDLLLEEDEEERDTREDDGNFPHKLQTVSVDADELLSHRLREREYKIPRSIFVGMTAREHCADRRVGDATQVLLNLIVEYGGRNGDAPDVAEAADEGPHR